MEKRNSGWSHWVAYIVMASILLFVSISCGSPESNCDYTTFVVQEDDPRLWNEDSILFSFEYPQCFNEVPWTDDLGIEGITDIPFTREGTEESGYGNLRRISVIIHRVGRFGNTDAKTTVDNIILDISTDEYIEDFQILDRSLISIAGLTAEYAQYTYHNPGLQYIYPYENTVKLVCFVHDGFVWKIDFRYGPEYDEEDLQEVEAWFDHLIETFQILD